MFEYGAPLVASYAERYSKMWGVAEDAREEAHRLDCRIHDKHLPHETSPRPTALA